MSRPAMEPTVQKRIRSRLFESVSTKAEMIAWSTAFIAAPPRMSVIGLTLPPETDARAKTTAVAIQAPPKAQSEVAQVPDTLNRAKEMTTARAAPEAMPRMPGSASGLRV